MAKERTKKLSTKLLLNLLCGILLPLGILFLSVTAIYTDLLKKEVRNNTEKTLSYCWENIESVFTGMVTVSAIMNNDSIFVSSLNDTSIEYYDRYVMFNRLLQTIYLQNFGLSEDTWIYLEDQSGLSYCNQPDHPILARKDFLDRQADSNGSICWDFNAHDNAGGKVFSMSRTFYNNNLLIDPAGTLTISIKESQLRPMLDKYVNLDTDCVLLYLDNGSLVTGYHRGTQQVDDLYQACVQQLSKHQRQSFISKIEGQKYLINDYAVDSLFDFEGHELHILMLSNYDTIFGNIDAKVASIVIVLIVAYAIVLVIGFIIPKRLISPIQRLDTQVRAFRVDDEPISCSNIANDEIGSLYKGFQHLTTSINTLFSNLKEESTIKENYHYESLRAQISPHFLFNTLNSIKFSAQIIHAENIVENIDALSKMLRYSMAKDDELVAFKCEIDNIQNYLQIQNNRFGNSIQLELDDSIAQHEENLVFKFILQPIVENCVLHGFKDYTDHGIIYISCKEEAGYFLISVQDNGRGFSEKALQDWQSINLDAKTRYSGLGLAAVHKIIQITSGSQYGLDIQSTPYEGTEVIYRLPIKKAYEEVQF